MFLSPSNLLTLKIECIPNSNDDPFYKYLNSAAGKRLITVVSLFVTVRNMAKIASSVAFKITSYKTKDERLTHFPNP